jgi:hypothetical protein
MRAEKIGRVLGIGLRVAGRMAGQKLMGEAQTAGAQAAGGAAAATGQNQQKEQAGQNEQVATAGQAAGVADARAKGQTAGRTAKGVARGVGGFLRPFRRVGGILWLEMTGAFFLLFVVAFGRAMWRVRASYAYGPDHMRFLGYAAMTAVFLYLGVSSFWRARRR